ncbi:MAG: hypothetical protein V3V14_12390 [Saprospiraceae bacterium]
MDKKEIRLSSTCQLSNIHTDSLTNKLSAKGFNCSKVIAENKLNDRLNKNIQQLIDSTIDVVVVHLRDLDTDLYKGIRIAITSDRADPSDCIITTVDNFDNTQPFRLKQKSTIGISSPIRKAQLVSLNSKLNIESIEIEDSCAIQLVINKSIDAVIVSTMIANTIEKTEGLEIIKMHPKEFVPACAQGVMAYLIRDDDMITLNILKQVGNIDVARITNVERKVLKTIQPAQNTLAVYCQTDQMGNYHTWSAYIKKEDSTLTNYKLSSSTFVGLSELIVQELTTDKTKHKTNEI